jgi:heat shock protein HslJ
MAVGGCASPQPASFKDIECTIEGETVLLEDGVAEREAAAGSAVKVLTRYFGNEVEGDLDGDGIPDVAFLLTQETGGSGVFFYLVGAIKTPKGYRGTHATFVGDRIAPRSTEYRDGVVVVNHAERRPGEPMVALPTSSESVRLRYDPETNRFEEVVRNVGGDAGGSRTTRPRVDAAARWVGLYAYMADAASFTDCATDLQLPVAMESDHAALERAYLAARREAGERMLVTLRGRVEARPRIDGEGAQHFLIATRHEQVWPGESCEKSTLETPLANTYWRLVELYGVPFETNPSLPRDVHIRFRSAEGTWVGFAGCSEVTGRYDTDTDRLRIELSATPPTACPHLEEEIAFRGALARVRRFLILGESLVLSSDAADVARFEATYLQ